MLFFSLLFGMLTGVDKRVSFRHAIHDEEYAFSYSGTRVTRAIEKILKKSLRFRVKYSSRGKAQYLVFSNSCYY